MISKLHVKNFKCLRDVSVELGPFTVLIGKNDTGKTSLLEALEVLAGLVASKPSLPRPVDKLAWRRADPPSIEWTAEVAPSLRNGLPAPATYSLRIAPSIAPGTTYNIQHESLVVPGTDVSAGHDREGGGYVTEGTKKRQTGGGESSRTALSTFRNRGVPTLDKVADALGGTAKYHFDPDRLDQPNAFPLRPGGSDEIPRLESDGDGLALVLDYLLGEKRKVFDTIQDELHKAVPFIKSIQLKRWTSEGGNPRPGRSLAFELASTGDETTSDEISADLASDGALLFLAYLTLVHAVEPPSVLLIEEPENGIHPRQLQRIAEYLKGLTDPARGASAVQIITATHSPYFLDFVPPDNVLVFGRKANGETVVAPLLSLPGVRRRLDSGFSLGEMWFNVGEDRLMAEILR
jgi:predicted ATPase